MKKTEENIGGEKNHDDSTINIVVVIIIIIIIIIIVIVNPASFRHCQEWPSQLLAVNLHNESVSGLMSRLWNVVNVHEWLASFRIKRILQDAASSTSFVSLQLYTHNSPVKFESWSVQMCHVTNGHLFSMRQTSTLTYLLTYLLTKYPYNYEWSATNGRRRTRDPPSTVKCELWSTRTYTPAEVLVSYYNTMMKYCDIYIIVNFWIQATKQPAAWRTRVDGGIREMNEMIYAHNVCYC